MTRQTTETRDWMEELITLQRQPQVARPDRPDITASAIADYAYCGRSWWIREQGKSPAAKALMEAGTQRHLSAGAIIAQGISLERLVKVCLAGAAILAIITGVLWTQI
jgi:hypothetical protein